MRVMPSLNLSLSEKTLEQIDLISEDTGHKPQEVIRTVLWLFFSKELWKCLPPEYDLSMEAKRDLSEKTFFRNVTRIKFEGIRDKRKVFFLKNARAFLIEARRKNNLTLNDLDLLMASFLKESDIYGLRPQLEKLIAEEKEAHKSSRAVYEY